MQYKLCINISYQFYVKNQSFSLFLYLLALESINLPSMVIIFIITKNAASTFDSNECCILDYLNSVTYLAPLSYGVPDALGAWDLFEVNVKTTKVAI